MSMGRPQANDTRVKSSHDAGAWLGFAASPIFALMAAISAAAAPAMSTCSSMSGGFSVDSMALMYALMSLFHVSPWLRLASRWLRHLTLSPTQAEGD